MNLRFVTKTIHAYLDYPVALALIGLPILLGLGAENPLARWLSIVVGVAAFVLTLFTDHKLGLIRVLPYSLHLTVDFLVGLLFVVAPVIFQFSGLEAWYYWLNGAAVLMVVSLHKPDSKSERLAQSV